MMPPDPPPTARGVKRQQSTCDGSGKCGAVDMSTTAGDDDQRERAADEGSGEEGEDGKGDGDGDDGVL